MIIFITLEVLVVLVIICRRGYLFGSSEKDSYIKHVETSKTKKITSREEDIII